jgi:hypothetical protein
MEPLQHSSIFENGLDERSKAYLLETTRWTKFLSIIGFIITGLMLLGAIAIMTMGSFFSSLLPGYSGLGAASAGIGFGLIYIIIAALYFYPIISLFRFSSNMKQGIQTNNMEMITEAFRHQKNLYKFIGIFTIIIIAFYLIIFLFFGIFAASFRH